MRSFIFAILTALSWGCSIKDSYYATESAYDICLGAACNSKNLFCEAGCCSNGICVEAAGEMSCGNNMVFVGAAVSAGVFLLACTTVIGVRLCSAKEQVKYLYDEKALQEQNLIL